LQVGGGDTESIAIWIMSRARSSSVPHALQPAQGSLADVSLLATSDINHKQQDFLRHCKIHVFWDVMCRTSRRFEGLILRYVGNYSHKEPASNLSSLKPSAKPLSEPPTRTTVDISTDRTGNQHGRTDLRSCVRAWVRARVLVLYPRRQRNWNPSIKFDVNTAIRYQENRSSKAPRFRNGRSSALPSI